MPAKPFRDAQEGITVSLPRRDSGIKMTSHFARWSNRSRLLLAFAGKTDRLNALPVEYVVETTAKCNLFCPMCPRETMPQPKKDMADETFQSLVRQAQGASELMMLVGLGEPLLDPKIYDRIAYCRNHGIATLISTNGTLLTEERSRKLLASQPDYITLSFDGISKEAFEFYRRGANFESVRENILLFARLKEQLGKGPQIVVQMIRLERNAAEEGAFRRFWRGKPGIDSVRTKDDETGLLSGESHSGRPGPCHYLWRGPMYVKWNGDVYPCCQSYMLGGRSAGNLGLQPLKQIVDSRYMRYLRRMHAVGRSSEIQMCRRCSASAPHPVLASLSLLLPGRFVRRFLPLMEGWSTRAGLLRTTRNTMVSGATRLIPILNAGSVPPTDAGVSGQISDEAARG